MSLNNVEKSLSSVGIALRDTTNSFRPLEDVIADIAVKWDDLNQVQQMQISNAVAGTRQANIFLSLMQNYGDVEKYVAEQTNAAGLAQDRYAIYLDSVEAAQNRLTASWEKLWQTTIDSGAITWFLDLGSSMLDVVSAGGGITPLLTAILGAFIALRATQIASFFKDAYASVVTFIQGLNTLKTTAATTGAVVNSSLGIIGLVITGISIAYMAVQANAQKAQREVEQLSQDISKLQSDISKLNQDNATLLDIGNSYIKLRNSTNRTNEEQKKFIDLQNQIHSIVPQVSGDYDEQGNFIIDQSVNLSKLLELKKEEIRINEEMLNQKINEQIGAQAEAYQKQEKELQRMLKQRSGVHGQRYISDEELDKQKLLVEETMNQIKMNFYSLSEQQKQAQLEILRNSDEFGQALARELAGGMADAMQEYLAGEKFLPPADEVASLAEEYTGFTNTIKSLNDQFSDLNSLIEKSITGQLEFSDISKIPEEYLDALTVENGQLRLNVDLIKQKQINEAEAAYESAKAAGESEQYVAVLKAYYDQLVDSQYVMLDGAQLTQGAFSELAWAIAENAAISGNSFVDMQGNALNSVEAIYSYLTSGDQAFNDFVRQAANITGQSVEDVMAQINSMLQTTASNAEAIINYLGASSLGVDSGFNRAPSSAPKIGQATIFKAAPTGYQYPGGLSDYSKSIGSSNSELDKQKQIEDQIKQVEDDIENARKKAIDNLKDQLDVYKDIIDARKEYIDSLSAERSYQQDIEDKNKEILKVQNELATLQLDTSSEAGARRLELQDELSNLTQELENIQYDYSADQQKAALDAEYKSLEDKINLAIKQVEGIQATSLAGFTSQLSSILNNLSVDIPQFHSGAEKGVVGGSGGFGLKSNELFAKLMAGEVVSNPDQIDNFMRKILPSIASGSPNASGDIEINMPISVSGNLDKTVLPDLEIWANRLMDKINAQMTRRGYIRRSDLVSI